MAGEAPIISTDAGQFATAPFAGTGVANRYALALFELAQETGGIDAVKADLDRFDALVVESLRPRAVGAQPGIFRRRAIAGALRGTRPCRNRRTSGPVPETRDQQSPPVCGPRHDPGVPRARRPPGEATAEVTVAEQLKDDHVAALRAALKAVSGKDVDLHIKVDPAIIGGLVVKLGSRMVDSSLRTKLNSIRHAMKEAR